MGFIPDSLFGLKINLTLWAQVKAASDKTYVEPQLTLYYTLMILLLEVLNIQWQKHNLMSDNLIFGYLYFFTMNKAYFLFVSISLHRLSWRQ